eukprot:g1996.t1
MEERSPRVEGESQTQRRRRMERLWVETHIRRLLAASPNENSTGIASFRSNRSELMLGAVLGFILGFIVMFWAADGSIPRHRRFGMVVGVAVNVGWGVLNHTPDSHDAIP